MENATKAMMIAGGVLIGVMIISLGLVLYSELGTYVESTYQDIRFNDIKKFNAQFTQYINYEGEEEKFTLITHDIITAANLAYENNIDHNSNISTSKVEVYLDGVQIDEMIQSFSGFNFLMTFRERKSDGTFYKYKCTADDVKMNPDTGRVERIDFHGIVE